MINSSECNICYDSCDSCDSREITKCTSCTFMICKQCINKLTNSLQTQCPMCKKSNTYMSTKHIVYELSQIEDCEKHDILFKFIYDFAQRYGSKCSIQLRTPTN